MPLLVVLLTFVATSAALGLEGDADAFFESKVRPLLAEKCYSCHRNNPQGGLRLDSRKSLLRGGNSGPALAPGYPQQSLLLQVVTQAHKRIRMPKDGEKLAEHEINALRTWIQNGAVWPLTAGELFREYVKPILEQQCLECHAGKKEGGLELTSRESVLAGGDSGAAVVPHDPTRSLLILAVRGTHDELEMPPTKPLSAEDVAYLEQWVAAGAPWSGSSLEGPAEFHITPEQRNFWSFQPLAHARPPLPTGHPIDSFVEAGLREKGLKANSRANKRTLLRRVTYDLTGLPPTQDELTEFLNDDTERAFEHVVDRLLESEQYGVRWGRHWLDLVRYADTAGDAADFPIPEAYLYRNYVIDSFNNDTPYDQFIREQIAGDLLAYDNDDQRWRQQIATGYVAISRRIGVSPQNQPHITIEDTLDNLGKTFLGLTVSCARCHDHKFDPISTADYYALYGIFDSTIYPHAGAEHKPHRENFVYRVGTAQADEILEPHRARVADVTKRERIKFEEYRALQRMDLTKTTKTRVGLWTEVMELRRQRGEIGATFPPLETAYAVRDGAARDVHVHRSGDPRKLGPLVHRGFLEILGGQQLSDDQSGSGRLELANWIADDRNPLTARVLVNRVWHYHFGRGLVASTSDFGVRGKAPTHPALLDYLAQRFMDEGWSIKQLHRLILSSQTYQRSSENNPQNAEIDPTNQYLWRANRRRLDAEQIRDSILHFAGDLDLSKGERHPFPHHMTYFFRQHEPFQETYETNRRSIYMMQQRIRKNPYLDLFDGPDGNIQFAERRATTTTLQALYLMNSGQLHGWADRIAEVIMTKDLTDEQRIDHLYRSVFGRPAKLEEIDQSRMYFAKSGRDSPAWSGYVRAMLSSNEFMFID